MKKYMYILLISFSNLIIFSNSGQCQLNYMKLSAKDFSDQISRNSDVQLVDVRTPGEFSKSHLINAKNINLIGNDFKSQLSKLDKSKPVFVCCYSGHRSSFAVKSLKKLCFKEIYELKGGLMKWRAANLQETTD